MYGYIGKMLFVNLSTSEIEVRPLDEEVARNFLGGQGLGAYILYKEMPAHTDAFAPESMIGFVAGPLNGTSALFGGRYTVVSKSPVYNGWNDANSGGSFGPKLKKAGFDAVFVKGIADHPVYIFIDDGKVEIRDARHLWGKTVVAAEEALREEIGDKRINAALIGPGGENLSYMAAVMNDSHRAAGRGGSGAVMGSKKLKAVVVRGNQKIEVYDKQKLLEINKQISGFLKGEVMGPIANAFGEYGTGVTYAGGVFNGDAGVKNWTGAGVAELTEEQANALGSPVMDPKYRVKKFACSTCPLGCGAIYKSNSEKWPLEETGRPEYETIGYFGSMVLNTDSDALLMVNHLCNEYGLDTMATGGTVGWLFECYNEGVISKEELDGIDLTWGNADGMVAITEKICTNEGCGKLFINGSRRAAETLNKGSDFLTDASGIEVPQHDARLAPCLARTYQYDPAPGRHVQPGIGTSFANEPPEVRYNYHGTGFRDLVATAEGSILNSSGICLIGHLLSINILHLQREMLNAALGFNYSLVDYHHLGQRIFTIRQAFNLREGLRRKDFKLTKRMLGGLTAGPLEGVTVDNELLTDNLYNALGWDMDGVPSKEALELLGGLDFVKDDLEASAQSEENAA